MGGGRVTTILLLSVAAVYDRRSALLERRYNLRAFVYREFSFGQRDGIQDKAQHYEVLPV